jgi:5-methylcytosine-specific restriction protein A
MFEKGKIFERAEIHDNFSGSRHSGNAASAQYPYIFIFSDRTGLQYGYIDRWENENIFSYSGEGQVGDMKMVRGNLVLEEHLRNQKRVFFCAPKVLRGF